MIKAIIFDCFGVLAQGTLGHFLSLVPPQMRQTVRDINRSADYGFISHDEYLRQMGEVTETSPEYIESYNARRQIRSPQLEVFVRSLRVHYKTALLTNAGVGIIERLFTDDELSSMFDVVVRSSDIGDVKPNPTIFEYAVRQLGVAPEEAVMIDDLLENIEGATAAGLSGIVFEGSLATLIDDLQRIGVTSVVDEK